MKKIILTFIVYLVVGFLCCFAGGVFTLPVPQIEASKIIAYRLQNGLYLGLQMLPAVAMTGFLLGCSIGFSQYEENVKKRFSSVLTGLYKWILIMALCITLVLTFAQQVFMPMVRANQEAISAIPFIVQKYLDMAQTHVDREAPEVAMLYIKKVLAMDSSNERAKALMRKAEMLDKEIDISVAERRLEESAAEEAAYQQTYAPRNETMMSTYDLLVLSQESFAEHKWFDAHYYATLAVRNAEPGDINLESARLAATEAWNRLSTSQVDGDYEANILYRKKLAGYMALLAGDYLEAYYAFHDISLENNRAHDADVVRYLAMAHEELIHEYFFIDETYDLGRFESAGNVYFAFKNEYEGTSILLVDGITDVEGTGGLLRYLRNLKIYVFDNAGRFLNSISAPYAKMLAFESSKMDTETKARYLIDDTKKIVPYLMLCSIDRNAKGIRLLPEYEFAVDQRTKSYENANQIFLPMPYDDFSLLVKACHGTEGMNPLELGLLSKHAEDFGFCREVYEASSLAKMFYPALLLISFIFIASIAWNYRLASGSYFKFIWIFILPLFNLIFYIVLLCVHFLIELLNYVFIASVGISYAIYIGGIIYLLLLIGVSILFLARKGD